MAVGHSGELPGAAYCGGRAWCAVLALALLLLAGCACYGHKPHRGAQEKITFPGSSDTLHFVEADDEGWFWQPQQADSVLHEIDVSASTQDTFVLVFVHGWHHSAACCDGNLEGFRDVIAKLRAALSAKMYADARAYIASLRTARLNGTGADAAKPANASVDADTADSDFRIIGVYVGWRGGSLPGLADYATFWGRKAAAERVGSGDLREFLQRLARRYDAQDQQSKDPARGGKLPPLLGLVTIGHSFGGQVVLSAVSGLLESRLVEAGAPSAWLRDPPPPRSEAAPVHLRGFGDLVLLVNPAVEAAAYQRIHALGRSLAYSPRQTPLLLTLSADDDKPRGRYFPQGRIAGELLARKPYKDFAPERQSERLALGFYAPQRTHCLAATDPKRKLHEVNVDGRRDETCAPGRKCNFLTYAWGKDLPRIEADTLSAASADPAALQPIHCHDLSARSVFSDVVLQPTAGAQPNQAFIVASAHRSVLTTHNGMFSQPLMQFLTSYAGFIEAKRFMPLLLPHPPPCPSPAPGERHVPEDFCSTLDR